MTGRRGVTRSARLAKGGRVPKPRLFEIFSFFFFPRVFGGLDSDGWVGLFWSDLVVCCIRVGGLRVIGLFAMHFILLKYLNGKACSGVRIFPVFFM